MPSLSDIIQPPGRQALACALVLATCALAACGPFEPEDRWSPQLESRVTLLNTTREMHVLRVREVRAEVQLDCEMIEQAPSRYLRDEVFGPSVRWTLYSDQELGLGIDNQGWGDRDDLNGRNCNAVLVQSDTVPDIVVFWDSTLQPKTFEFDADIPEYIKPDPQTIALRADYSEVTEELKPYRFRPCGDNVVCGPQEEAEAAEIPDGARYFWETHYTRQLHHEREWLPDDRPQPVSPRCEAPGPRQGLHWPAMRLGQWIVRQVERGVDGCHTLHLENTDSGASTELLFCMPFDALDSLTNDSGQTYAVASFDATSRSGSSVFRISVEYRDADDGGYVGTGQILLSAGRQMPPSQPVDLELQPREGCAPVAAACGQVDVPLDALVNLNAAGPDEPLRPGESTELTLRDSHFYLVRAVHRPVLDPGCEQDRVSSTLAGRAGTYVEAVTVIRH